MSIPPIPEMISQVLASIYDQQAVRVTVVDDYQLLVEAYGSTRQLTLSSADSFESVFENLVHWIEICLSYSWSQSPRMRVWIDKMATPSRPANMAS